MLYKVLTAGVSLIEAHLISCKIYIFNVINVFKLKVGFFLFTWDVIPKKKVYFKALYTSFLGVPIILEGDVHD